MLCYIPLFMDFSSRNTSPTKMLLLLIIISSLNLISLAEAAPLLNQPPIQAILEPGLYVLALQWGISFCRDQTGLPCRQPVLQNFTVHYFARYGSSLNDTILPPCTAGRDLYMSDVDGVMRMNEDWPSHLLGVSNFEFWRQQWRKHGRCLGLTPEQYFQKVLDLKKQIDDMIGGSLVQFFRDKGLAPSETNRYDPRRFLAEIQVEMGVITQMQCNINKEGVYQLLETRFCFTNKWKLRNCPSHDRPAISKNKQAAKRKGPNSQRKSPPPPPPRLPSFHTGMCYGQGLILFPALIPASPPPPRRTVPPPPPPPHRKSPPLKRKQSSPPPQPMRAPLRPVPPTESPPPKQKQRFAAPTPMKAPLRPVPPTPCKSPPERQKQPPPAPPPPTPVKTPFPPSLSSYTLTYKQILVKGNYPRPPPTSSAPPNVKRGRRWKRFLKPNLTLRFFLFQFAALVVILMLIRPHYRRAYLRMQSLSHANPT